MDYMNGRQRVAGWTMALAIVILLAGLLTLFVENPLPFGSLFLTFLGVCGIEWSISFGSPRSWGKGIIGFVASLIGILISLGIPYALIENPNTGVHLLVDWITGVGTIILILGLFRYSAKAMGRSYY